MCKEKALDTRSQPITLIVKREQIRCGVNCIEYSVKKMTKKALPNFYGRIILCHISILKGNIINYR
jgi:hypothetical protein